MIRLVGSADPVWGRKRAFPSGSCSALGATFLERVTAGATVDSIPPFGTPGMLAAIAGFRPGYLRQQRQHRVRPGVNLGLLTQLTVLTVFCGIGSLTHAIIVIVRIPNRPRTAITSATRGRCFPVCAAALRPAQAGPASHHRSLARSAAACMGARWDQAPHVATTTRLSMAALLARLLRNAGTFENWCGRRASCSSRLSNLGH
jgi:hypothetical protein